MALKKTSPKKGLIKRFLLGTEDDLKNEEAPDEKFFEMQGGKILKTPADLIGALKVMTSEQFDHHTKQGRNDFANWLWFVFDEKKLADKIFKTKTQSETLRILEKHYV